MQEIVTQKANPLISAADSQIDLPVFERMLSVALDPNCDLDKLDRLLDMKQKHEAAQAKKAFYAALCDFQSKIKPVKGFKNGHNNMYATFADIIAQTQEQMHKSGFSYRFEQSQEDDKVCVKCILIHSGGHSESCEMRADPDASGGKNKIQAISSTVSYLKRYTFLSVTGVTTADQDHEYRVWSSQPMSSVAQSIELDSLCEQLGRSQEKAMAYVSSKLGLKPIEAWTQLTEKQADLATEILKSAIRKSSSKTEKQEEQYALIES